MTTTVVESGITDADIREFTGGWCGELAVAMHDATGWPIVLVCDEDGETPDALPIWLHAGVRTPDGLFLDVTGAHDDETVIKAWEFDDESQPGDYWLVEVTVEAFRPNTMPCGRPPSTNTGRVRDHLIARYAV